MSILERKGRFRCNSHYCPGDASRTLCNAILSVTSTEDKKFNLLETAIKMWESGEAEERCRGMFKEKPTNHDEYMQYEYEITDTGSKKEIYKCTGKVIGEGLKFVHNPPFIQFEIENKLGEKIKDLNLIPKSMTIYEVKYILGGCTYMMVAIIMLIIFMKTQVYSISMTVLVRNSTKLKAVKYVQRE